MQSTCRASIAPSSRGMSSEKKRRKAQWAHHQHISIISIASYRIALSFDLRTLPYILHLLRAFTHEYRNPPLNGGFPIRCGLCEHSPGISLWMVPSGSLLWMPSIASYRIALSFDLRTLPYILHLLRAFTHEYRNPPLNGGFPIRCGLCEHSPGISLWMVPSGSLLWMPMWEQACSTIIVEDRVIRRHTVDDSLARGKSQALALPCYPWLSCKTRC